MGRSKFDPFGLSWFLLMFLQESDLEELERTVEPSWPKLVEPLEKIIDQLTILWSMINHLKAVKDSPELRAAIEEVQVNCYLLIINAHEFQSMSQNLALIKSSF